MHGVRTGLIVFALVAVTVAQSPEPPLADSRLTVHTLLREDIFAGFMANDMKRFERGERNIAALLEQRPDQRANLLAWKGSTTLYRAVLANESGNTAEYHRLLHQARDLFAEAAKASSGNDGVVPITGGTFAIFADRLPADVRAVAWSQAYDAYRALWTQQEPAIAQMPVHLRGEVLSGLAQAAQRTGRTEEAAQYVDKMLTILKDTPYEATAKRWKSDPAAAANSSLTCKTCHEPGRLSSRLTSLNK